MVPEQRDRTTVLDHGYVELIEAWGSDERIIEAARMSTDKGFQGWGPKVCSSCGNNGQISCKKCSGTALEPGDEKLLAYLWRHKHATPFEMAGMTIEVQCPIFVLREWHRHRTQSYSELSARYTPLPDLSYTPNLDRLAASKQSMTNKQSSEVGFDGVTSYQIQKRIDTALTEARDHYEWLLSKGVSREIARLVIPVAQYSRMRASANLRNWLAFLTLRMGASAQWEIRQYANAVGDLIAEKFPRTWQLFNVKGPVIT